jgi:hypothetical protein
MPEQLASEAMSGHDDDADDGVVLDVGRVEELIGAPASSDPLGSW